jgi:cytochrome bd ubiquinol oxidase subunit I
MIWLIYWSFRAMVGFGILMSVAAIVGIYLWWRGSLTESPRYLAVLPFLIVLPYVANATGWVLTELGRQPWIVQGLMKTEEGCRPT